RIVERLARETRRTPVAEDLDLEPVARAGELGRNVAERERGAEMVGVAARGDPADRLAAVPHRLVADGVRVRGVDAEEGEAPLRPGRPLACRRLAADEVVLGERDEAIEPGL